MEDYDMSANGGYVSVSRGNGEMNGRLGAIKEGEILTVFNAVLRNYFFTFRRAERQCG